MVASDQICPCLKLENSYDGTSKVTVHIGAFRFVCMNLAVGGGGCRQHRALGPEPYRARDPIYPADHPVPRYAPLAQGETLAERLRLYRARRGLSQEGLAVLLRVDESTVQAWESERNRPSLSMRRRILMALQ